tara:strand:- start:58958 stop:59470 length:513 start_codon:yes stop_codon:yes gene_type:complete
VKQDTNNYWEQLERMEKLIRASEFKAGVVFSFHSLILGFFADRLDSFASLLQEKPIFFILLIFWFLAVFVSIYFCFRCFKPHMELTYDKNVFFFKDAVYRFGGVKEYAKELVRVCATEEEIVEKLSEQIHAESVIIDKKFYNVKRATQFFILSFVFLIISLVYWIFITVL